MTATSTLTAAPAPLSLVPGLRARWAAARSAALHKVLRGSASADDPAGALDVAPGDLLARAWAADPEVCLRGVFDNSRLLGQSFSRAHRVDLTIRDVAQLLPALGAPCHRGGFVRVLDEDGFRCTTVPCADAARPGLCDTWRESIHGLAGGLSTALCFSRLTSPPHGGAACVDVVFAESHSPLRYLPPTEEQQRGLDLAVAHVRRLDSGTRIELLGLLEGELHYRLTPSRGGHGFDPHKTLRRALRRHVPGLGVCDASPRPVLTESP